MPLRFPFLLPRRPWLRLLLLAGLIILVLAFAAHVVPRARAAASLPTGGAQWIWKRLDRKDHEPTAFYAIRDFDLESPPARARLLVTADEEYVLTLNAKRIGAGAYEPGAPLDVYEVGPLLFPGGNRLVVELRSGRGAGGLLLSLEDPATGSRLVVSDESWRLFPRHELGLVRGWLPIGSGEPAFCWGYPPLGRWGRPRVGKPGPRLTRAARPPLLSISSRPLALDLGSAESGRPPGSPVLYDWGHVVEGYLTLDLRPAKDMGAALLFTGDEPPEPLRARPSGSVLILPGRRDWLDARPRRFRYALLVGLTRPAAAAVLPLLPGEARQARPSNTDRAAEMRVFGVEGPPLRTPVEDEVWGKLQRFAGVARREEL